MKFINNIIIKNVYLVESVEFDDLGGPIVNTNLGNERTFLNWFFSKLVLQPKSMSYSFEV